MAAKIHPDVETYVASYTSTVQRRLRQVRTAILRAAPDADETFAYGMPAYKHHGPLLYFAAFKTHIGLYPVTPAIKRALAKELKGLGGLDTKGTLRLPHTMPIPTALIGTIVKLRLNENLARAR